MEISRRATGELIVLCQKGERSAQSDFYHKYRQEVARTVHRVLGPSSDLEDTVQDVFIEVFRSIATFKGNSRFTTWLYRLCVNVSLQKIRRQKRRPESPLEDQDERPTHETPLRVLERSESVAMVYNILATLSAKKRVVFILHDIIGLEPKEIAEIVGANILTVRTRLHYARKEFYQKVLDTPLFAQEKL